MHKVVDLFFKSGFFSWSTRFFLAANSLKVTELRINESFLTTEGSEVKNEFNS